MGSACSNCNCNRDEKEHELKIEEVKNDGLKVQPHSQSFNPDDMA